MQKKRVGTREANFVEDEEELEPEDVEEDDDDFDPDSATVQELADKIVEQLDPETELHRSLLRVQLPLLLKEALQVIYGCVDDILDDLADDDE